MKKILFLSFLLLAIPKPPAHAQTIAQIIQEGIKKVIKAVDLKIQRLQNKTIWLQNAQKAIENTLSKLRLDEITDWVSRQRTLYQDYFQELSQVKDIITYYHRIREITDKQVQLVREYHRAYDLFQQDNHFTTDEIQYMGKVYSGILDESIKNLDQILLAIQTLATSMTDAQRMDIINKAADKITTNYADMKRFTKQNMLLSLQRAKDQEDVDVIRKLYDLQ